MDYIAIAQQVLFAAALGAAGFIFLKKIQEVRLNILMGRQDGPRTDRPEERAKNVLLLALGQKKMFKKPLPALLHLFVYVGFLVVNLEMLEVVLDGLLGTHRILGHVEVLQPVYNATIWLAEIFMVLVLFGVSAMLFRRHVLGVKRFTGVEMKRWPLLDADIILYSEMLLSVALLLMNASEQAAFISKGEAAHVGSFPVSQYLTSLFGGIGYDNAMLASKVFWWLHIIGVLSYLNYLPYSKHFHIMLAFPNSFFARLEPKGKLKIDERVKKEVELMTGGDPFAAPAPDAAAEAAPQVFGAKDVSDLSWKSLMDAYTCTECGRCTQQCPANITGKLLSPRKIMMDTRDRMEEVGRNRTANNGTFQPDGKSLLGDYISHEELWACTTCNACVEACPVSINPVDIIVPLRQYLAMEASTAPAAWNSMFVNTENNGAPWAMPASNRFNWAEGIEIPADKLKS